MTWDDWHTHIQQLREDPGWLASPRFTANLQSVTDTLSIGEKEAKQATWETHVFFSNFYLRLALSFTKRRMP